MPFKSTAFRAKKWNPIKPYKRVSQLRTSLSKFISNVGQTSILSFDFFTSTNQQVSSTMNLALIESLVNDTDLSHDDKLARAMDFYAR